jgi:hypothetical protein
MERQYVIRGKLKTIEEFDRIVAVLPLARKEVRPEDLDLAFGQRQRMPTKVSDEKGWQTLESAGWLFVEPNDEVKRALESGTSLEGAEAVQRVFLQPSGRILLGTNRLSVRLRADMTQQEVSDALDKAGLEIIGQLKFAPNLYEVRTRPGRDFLQASLDLSGNPDFLYAEPQFIEHIPQRRAQP